MPVAAFKHDDGRKKHKAIRKHAPTGLPLYSGVVHIKSIINTIVAEVSQFTSPPQSHHAL